MALAKRIVAIAGGVGGAKLAHGLQMHSIEQYGNAANLTVIVNTGDDFIHYGLNISPDLDTVMYTLGGVADPINGWGIANDTRQMIGMMKQYNDEGWFGLGDKDLATHLIRTQALANGQTLTQVTQHLSRALGISAMLLPMSDQRLATIVETQEHGVLGFQEYFVRYRWQPTVTKLCYDGEETATATPQVLDALHHADVIIFCPSNPMLSIEPILRVQGIRDAFMARRVPLIAVSPIIAGKAIKGPAAKIMAELGFEPSVRGISDYYGNLVDALVIDTADEEMVIPHRRLITATIMHNMADRVRLAKDILSFVENWQ